MVPADLVGREVSVRAVLPLWEAIRRRGMDPAVLAVGTGCSVSQLTDPRERISWTAFMRVLDNLAALVDEDEIVAIGAETLESAFTRAILAPGRYLFGIADVYRWMAGPHAPAAKMFAQAEGACTDVAPGRVRFEVHHKPGYPTSRPNFLLLQGALRAFGTAFAGEPAHVTMTIDDTSATYDIRVAQRRTLLDRARPYLRPAVDWLRKYSSLQRAHEELYGRFSELEREVNTRIVIESELRRAEELSRQLFDKNPLPMFVIDIDTLKFLDVNAAAIRHYGYTRGEILAMTLADIRPEEDVPAMLEQLQRGNNRPRIWRHRKRDGSIILVEITTHSIALVGKRARLAVANDVTARHHLEDQLREAQKMEAVGHLAGGVAHDFNNLLSVIINTAELQLRDETLPERVRRDVETILAAAERGSEMTRRLLSLSQRQLLAPKVIDLGDVLRDMQPLLAGVVRENIRIVLRAAQPVGVTRVDRESIERVVMNLVVNARDAMPHGGTITIEASLVELDETTVAAHGGTAPGAYAVLAVTDTGVGMDEATRAKVFEPYFTTKPAGQGTGLGLPTVLSIVEQGAGHIRVDSALGRGSRFEIYLPAFSS